MNHNLFRKGSLSEKEIDRLWERIDGTVCKRRTLKRVYTRVAAAAAIVLVAAGGWFYADMLPDEQLLAIEEVECIVAQEGKVQLILADERKVDIEQEDAQLRYDKKGELHINSRKVDVKPDASNQLIVPSGKRSYLELSDGSKVWVNANTRVVYPVTFDIKKREIYVDGEIYIEVFPDKKRPFIVKSPKMNVQVLGTTFNFSTHNTSDSDASVVLVTGKVKVTSEKKMDATLKQNIVLQPNERLSYNDGVAEVSNVNVNKYITWRNGHYSYDNERFSVVLDKLAHYYGKKIVYDAQVGQLRCSGTLTLGDDVYKVLPGLGSTMPVDFKIEPEVITVVMNH